MIWDYDKWKLGSSKLLALTQIPANGVPEDIVSQFHEIIALFEAATRKDMSSFKIPNDRLKQIPIRRQLGGTHQMSRERFCESIYFANQHGGLLNYVKMYRDEIVQSQEDFMANIRGPKPMPNPTSVTHNYHFDKIQNSALIAGSPGATIKNSFNAKSAEFGDVVRKIKSAIPELNLSKSDADLMHAEVKTIEAQIESPAPRYTTISESADSLRSILEGLAANVLTTGLLTALNYYFPR
jgi:hypothetical protein